MLLLGALKSLPFSKILGIPVLSVTRNKEQNRTSLACDPVTGSPLVIANSNNFFVYNATADQWTKITSPPVVLNNQGGAQAAMAPGIPEYGVVFYMSPDKEKVYLYKHANTASTAKVPARHMSLIHTKSRIEMYDLKGRRIEVLNNRLPLVPGPEGIYLIKTGSYTYHSFKKLTILR